MDSTECVILLHGLARSHRSMSPLEKALREQGYQVVNSEYDSLAAPIETLALTAIDQAVAECPTAASPIHFVTHSLGGILVRQYAQLKPSAAIGRVVMLGPPNQGSELVDQFAKLPGFDRLNGFAGRQLGTTADSTPNQLPAVNFELGVIAGSKSINPLLSYFLPGKDDGKVSIGSTKLDGMKEHLVLPTTHTFMMRNSQVIAQVNHFLSKGEFLPSNP
ncbi:MAG: alpha/beta hydrolase [Cellvibrionaceae bacterium]|nr:alpha/beta hydrolase [Cellvibrionaceae bacterium]